MPKRIPRHEKLKKLLDILTEHNCGQDIISYLVKPENLKVINEIDCMLSFFDETLMQIPTLRISYEKQDYVKETNLERRGDKMTGYIRKFKVIKHTDFETDTKYRLESLEIKINEIIDKLNEIANKVSKLEG